MSMVSRTDTDQEITSFDCINNIANCAFKASYDRSGGNEYLRADGGNSLINDHLTFIETKGDSPLKCIRWANTDRSGTGTWTQELDEDCGVGIYKNEPHPVMVDVVADTGTFKNILLDKECKVYSWNGTNVVDSGLLSPCGTNVTTGEVYQVVENIRSKEITAGILYGDNANFAVANIQSIFSDTISTNTIDVLNSLKVGLIKELQSGLGTTFEDSVTIQDVLRVINDVYFSNNLNVQNAITSNSVATNSLTSDAINANTINTTTLNSTTINNSGNVDISGTTNLGGTLNSNNTVNINGSLNLNSVQTLNASCSPNGSLARDSIGSILSCVSGRWSSSSSKNITRVNNYSFTIRERIGRSQGDWDYRTTTKYVSCPDPDYSIIIGAYGSCYSGGSSIQRVSSTTYGVSCRSSQSYNTTGYASSVCLISK